MISIHQLLEVLGPHITEQWVRFLPEQSFIQLHVLDGQPVSQPRLLYLGTPDTFILAADRLIRTLRTALDGDPDLSASQLQALCEEFWQQTENYK